MGTHENKRYLTISAWNVRGLGDKIQDDFFIDKIQSDINILLETWKGECKDYKISNYNTFSKIRKKKKKARRHSGGIIVYYKKEIAKGITNINGTKSQNRLWLKLEKEFFGFKEDLYLCALYIPPINSNYFENDYSFLENEISTFARQGKILLMGDMNARTGKCPDFITGDSCQINNFDAKNLIPNYYEVDTEISRNNQDNVTNVQGKSLLELCIASRLRILNGRFIGDSLGYYTYMSINGYSAVDYALISESLLSSVKYFKTDDFTYLSDHVQIQLTLNCNIKQTFDLKSHIEKKWKYFKRYKWTENSHNLLLKALMSEHIKNDIMKFELNEYQENQKGVDGATENLTNIFENISDITCKITKRIKSKRKKYRQAWSDNCVYETKKK
ncbi:unnamed protein product [Mytilus edulis]|uniref:Endonuclease/exonuclease/phosphatase domain-containing protein n=1 Tax=Mytilus edulis TaxID=6550 RepID=A0A8S3VRX1_MYTED|nr:unnamed protein product [Mytilus edulis]